ncbi:MAG: hypothetical protein O3A25_13175 [Acidobacteria bacterium]|nr:hypothetical protein [Acidobacteriota bacterium]
MSYWFARRAFFPQTEILTLSKRSVIPEGPDDDDRDASARQDKRLPPMIVDSPETPSIDRRQFTRYSARVANRRNQPRCFGVNQHEVIAGRRRGIDPVGRVRQRHELSIHLVVWRTSDCGIGSFGFMTLRAVLGTQSGRGRFRYVPER